MADDLRTFLDRRERELAEALADKHHQFQEELRPIEAELAEVRRAKGALGMPRHYRLHAEAGTYRITDGEFSSARSITTTGVVISAPRMASQLHSPNVIVEAAAVVGNEAEQYGTTYQGPVSDDSPYARLTMKDLVRKALREHFKDGATAQQLLDFFRDAWGRHIERHNLSPQLSRLRSDEEIGWKDNVWFLLKAKAPNGAATTNARPVAADKFEG